MRRLAYFSLLSLFFISFTGGQLLADAEGPQPASKPVATAPQTPAKPFVAFTGKLTKNKVRMRLQPNLDGLVIKEMNKDELVVVLGENEDFYAVQPPQETKGYVFRTFVLDNVVEGNKVNVRLEPNTDAPVIAQVNQGDRVQGMVSPINSKWLEIAPPTSARFYIAKEYVERVGDPSMMATIAKRREEVNRLLNAAYAKSQEEMQKPYEEIQFDVVTGMYQKVINSYAEFTDQVGRAKELLSNLQDAYLRKKVAYLESKNQQLTAQQKEAARNAALNAQKLAQQQQAQPIAANTQTASTQPSNITMASYEVQSQPKQNNWMPIEQNLYSTWVNENGQLAMEDYYQQQRDNAVILKGIIEPNNTTVKNKPGDYILVNPNTQLPIAYLYSTQIDLHAKVGQNVVLQASPRPNHHFAFPAYFVLGVN